MLFIGACYGLGIWALGPMVTRFVPGGYQPDHAGETTVERVRRAGPGELSAPCTRRQRGLRDHRPIPGGNFKLPKPPPCRSFPDNRFHA